MVSNRYDQLIARVNIPFLKSDGGTSVYGVVYVTSFSVQIL